LAAHLKHDWRSARLSAADQALCAWAEKLTLKVDSMGPEDVRELENQGFSQVAISDAAQVIAYFNYINRIAEGLGVDPEKDDQ
jgi:uncharacterized peroxidase-related enzyme